MRMRDWSSDVCSSDLVPESRHELRSDSAVNGSVIKAGGGRHHGGERQFTIHVPRLANARRRAEDQRLGWVDHREHLINAEHAEVRSRAGAASILLRRSEERRGGDEWVSTCRARWALDLYKKKKRKQNSQ